MQLDFNAIFAEHVAATQKVWAHDRKESVGASEAFGCIRHTWFKKRAHELTRNLEINGAIGVVPRYPMDDDAEDSWGASRRGDILEEHYVVPAIRDHLPGRAKLLFCGQNQKTMFQGHNSATPDGIIVGLDADALAVYGIPDIGADCIMLEIKSIDPRVSLHEEKAIHRGQTQVQMGIVRETTDFKPNFAVILYVDASFLDHIRVFVIPYDEEAWTAAKTRATRVFTVDDPAEMLPEGKVDKTCEYCEFQTSCAYVTTGAIPPENKSLAKDAALAADFEEPMANLRVLQQAAKDANKALEEAKLAIKDDLRRAGIRKIGPKDKRWTLSWYSQAGQKSLDRAQIMEALGVDDLESYCKEGDPFDVLRVSFSD
jgi:hypothetical protein